MNDLGPAPAPSLQPLQAARSTDRDPRERQGYAASRKPSAQTLQERDPAPEPVADSDNGEQAHQLDERA